MTITMPAGGMSYSGHDPDHELVRRILAGDTLAFETLIRRHNRVLYRTARSILRDDTEAEDVLQDAYLRAFQALGTFRGEAGLRTWLTRIVINEAIARTRKSGRRAQIIDIAADVQWDSEHRQTAETDMDDTRVEQPDQAAARAQTRRLIEKKIDLLPEAFRTVFMLRAVEDMPVEEVAACLQIPEATVRTRFFRARHAARSACARGR